MPKYRLHRWFAIVMGLYFCSRLLRHYYPQSPAFLKNHFTDILFVPAMCLFALIILRYIKKNPVLTLPWFAILFQTAIISYYFEGYLPSQKNNPYVGDILDVICYFIGAFIFIVLQASNFSLLRMLPQLNKSTS